MSKTRVPAIEGWFTEGNEPALLGTRCTQCRTLFFPKETFACRNPSRSHQQLLEGYIGQVFRRGATPAEVSRAYRRLLAEIIANEEDRILDHPVFDLAIHTARSRSGGSRATLLAALLAAGLLSLVTARATGLLFERVLFHSCPSRWRRQAFDGCLVPLGRDNLLAAALASGTVPLYLESVRDIPGAARGAYVDGALTDYHLNQVYLEPGSGIVLLPHYRSTLLPRWLDRLRPSRRPKPEAVADVLQIYPSAEFLSRLPDRRIPDRDDFERFADDPRERIRRWWEATSASEALGEQFLTDLESGRLPELVRPL